MVMRLRLASGLILFLFVACHLLNHALGLWSLVWMEDGRAVFNAVWRNLPMTVLLYGALVVHFVSALRTLYLRRSLRMPWRDLLQVALGLALPLLLAAHVAGTRLAHELFAVDDRYAYVLYAIWIDDPGEGIAQSLLLLAVWLHAAMGLNNWLRLKPWFPRWSPWLLGAATLVPVLGLAGMAQGARQVGQLAGVSGWFAAMAAQTGLAASAGQVIAMVNGARPAVAEAIVALAIVLILLRVVRDIRARRLRPPALTYPDGRRVELKPGQSVLEASNAAGIPHASMCGGRGRCSTCRVRVGAGADQLAAPSAEEQRVLDRIGAPPSVRLACQLRPLGDLAVAPLLIPQEAAGRILAPINPQGGEEREVAVLFADLRGFTTLAEDRLPYDTVFVLNRYFAAMGKAVEDAGGRVDKFIGDGVMALFGLDSDGDIACRRALDAADRMGIALEKLNASLAGELPAPLRMGIGIHAGPAVVGEMGYGETLHLTAIGDVVNAASRLEGATKDLGVTLVVSDETMRRAGRDTAAMVRHELDVRGRRGRLTAWSARPRAIAPQAGS